VRVASGRWDNLIDGAVLLGLMAGVGLLGYAVGRWHERAAGPSDRPVLIADGDLVAPPPASVIASRGGGADGPGRYHRPDCGFARRIAPANRHVFASAAEARQWGHTPCERCRP
jgi:hypothetical protein